MKYYIDENEVLNINVKINNLTDLLEMYTVLNDDSLIKEYINKNIKEKTFETYISEVNNLLKNTDSHSYKTIRLVRRIFYNAISIDDILEQNGSYKQLEKLFNRECLFNQNLLKFIEKIKIKPELENLKTMNELFNYYTFIYITEDIDVTSMDLIVLLNNLILTSYKSTFFSIKKDDHFVSIINCYINKCLNLLINDIESKTKITNNEYKKTYKELIINILTTLSFLNNVFTKEELNDGYKSLNKLFAIILNRINDGRNIMSVIKNTPRTIIKMIDIDLISNEKVKKYIINDIL